MVGCCVIFDVSGGYMMESNESLLERYCASKVYDGDKLVWFDKKIRDELVLRNMRLVHYVIHGLKGNIEHIKEDLVQEGVLGLLDAIDRYDVNLGCRFSTYAVWWIRQRIYSFVYGANNQLVKISMNIMALIMKLNKKECDENIDIGNVLGVNDNTVKRIEDALSVLKSMVVSLEANYDEMGNQLNEEVIINSNCNDGDMIGYYEILEELRKEYEKLDDRKKMLIKGRGVNKKTVRWELHRIHRNVLKNVLLRFGGEFKEIKKDHGRIYDTMNELARILI